MFEIGKKCCTEADYAPNGSTKRSTNNSSNSSTNMPTNRHSNGWRCILLAISKRATCQVGRVVKRLSTLRLVSNRWHMAPSARDEIGAANGVPSDVSTSHSLPIMHNIHFTSFLLPCFSYCNATSWLKQQPAIPPPLRICNFLVQVVADLLSSSIICCFHAVVVSKQQPGNRPFSLLVHPISSFESDNIRQYQTISVTSRWHWWNSQF